MLLIEFLIEAKTRTYASGGEGSETRLSDGSLELAYQAGEFRYRDRYFGYNPFAGEEVVFQGERVVWLMNYFGRLLSEQIPPAQVYGFLQQAMRRVEAERPYRGPRRFVVGDLEYRDESQGGPESFVGTERIFYRGQEVYRLDYHGGRLG